MSNYCSKSLQELISNHNTNLIREQDEREIEMCNYRRAKEYFWSRGVLKKM